MKAVSQTVAALGTPIFTKTLKMGPSLAVTIARWRHGDADVRVAASDTTLVALSLQDRLITPPARGEMPVRVGRAGSTLVVPAHHPTEVSIQGKADILQIFVSEAVLEAAAGARASNAAALEAYDGNLEGAAVQLLVAAMRRGGNDSRLLEAGIDRIARHFRNRVSRLPKRGHGGLERLAFRRVDDLITAAVDGGLPRSPTLAQLADAANLSADHFTRAFHARVGTTPHRHVVRRRLQRAIGLLNRSGTSVADVADEAGFATPAHFVATFRQIMGVTPGAVRAALHGE